MSKQQTRPPYARRKTRLLQRILLLFLLLVTAAVVALLLYANTKYRRIGRIEAEEVPIDRALETFEVDAADAEDSLRPEDVTWNRGGVDPTPAKSSVTNILLIGQDARPGEGRQRSDSMILCTIDTDRGVITMVSFMRDMYVPIPGFSDNRINAAYAFGGMPLLDRVLTEDFGVTIDANVEVDFDGFLAVMSEVGDLPISLTAAEAAYLKEQWNASWPLVEGTNFLTPEQALAYARIRHVGRDDYERTARQRKVLSAAFAKLRRQDVASLMSTADRLLPYVKTDMTRLQMSTLLFRVLTGNMQLSDESFRIPADGTYTPATIHGMSVLIPNLAENAAYLQEILYP